MEEEIIWNDVTQELLVEYVKCYPSLWDRRHVDYSRKDKNWRRWGKIGHFLDCSGEEAQHQFHLLKKRFLKYVDKLKKNNFRRIKPFFLAEKMGYLLCSESFELIAIPVKNRNKLSTIDSFQSLNLEAVFAYSEGTNTQDDIITETTQAAGDPAAVSPDAFNVPTDALQVPTDALKVSTDGLKVKTKSLKVSAPSWTDFGVPRRPPPTNFEEAISVYAEVLGGPFDEDGSSDGSSTPKTRSMRNRKKNNFCTRNKFKNKKKVLV